MKQKGRRQKPRDARSFFGMRNWSLRSKLNFSFLLIVIPAVLIAGLSMGMISYRSILQESTNSVEFMLDRIAEDIDAMLEECIMQGNIIASDVMVRDYLRLSPEDPVLQTQNSLLDDRLIFLKNYTLTHISSTYVIGENGGNLKTSPYFFRKVEFREEQWYKNILAQPEPMWMDLQNENLIMSGKGSFKYVDLGVRLEDKTTGDILGVALIEVYYSAFLDKVTYTAGETASEGTFFSWTRADR